MRNYTYSEIEKRLLKMPRFQDVGGRAARFGVDQIREFCDAIGNPEKSFKSIHVAGTNGKGTVCSIMASIFKEEGYKVGLYTSPHLHDVRERFRIQGHMMPKEILVQFFEEHDDQLNQFPLTFFELTTAIAFWWFAREKVDVAVIETGLGGRLDATNILHPLVSVITSIGLDHTEQLGPTISSIAFEKAGILKPGVPFVLGEMDQEAVLSISNTATEIGAKRHQISIQVTQNLSQGFSVSYENQLIKIKSDLVTPHIEDNMRIVFQSLHAIRHTLPVSESAIVKGFAKVRKNTGLIGRFEKIHADYLWYFDGGHNSQAMNAVQNHLTKMYSMRDTVVILSLMSDKLTPELIEVLNRYKLIYYVELPVPRALSYRIFQKEFPNARAISADKKDRISTLNYLKTELVLFTGSFYFYSTVSEWMESLSLDSKCAETSPSTKNQIAKN